MIATAKFDVPVTSIAGLRHLIAMDGDGRLKYGDDERGIRHDNNLRALWAGVAVCAFADQTMGGGAGEEPKVVIGDLIANLMHLCDALGLNFAEIVRAVRDHHYLEELAGT